MIKKPRKGLSSKYLALIFLSFLSFSVQAQWIKPNNSYIKSTGQSIDSTLFIPTGCDTPSLRGVDLHKMALYGDTCNNILYKYNPKDSSWSEAGGVSRSTVDSLLGGYYTKTQVDSIITVINSSLDLKVNISDTSSMLSPYTPRSELGDTAAKKYSSATQIDSTSYSLNKVNGDKTVFVFDGGSESSGGITQDQLDDSTAAIRSDFPTRPYTVYTAQIEQTGTSAPTADVLENTTGYTFTYSYVNTGWYTVTCSGNAFTTGHSYVYTQNQAFSGRVLLEYTTSTQSEINLLVRDKDETNVDGMLTGTIEIRIYP